ncbi:MAG TPA: DUF4258 domain-containing protein [Candidatus Woesebacteria bacterium]|nr:DUF4258 domain-containing protein [Candidatus Woesebacteria bacterium]
MSYSQQYKGLIWTNHALQRLEERKIPQDWAWRAFKFPDSIQKGKKSGTVEHTKQYNALTVTLIATKNEKKEWIIISCWVDPPLPGSIDIKKQQEYVKRKNETTGQKIVRFIIELFIPKKS